MIIALIPKGTYYKTEGRWKKIYTDTQRPYFMWGVRKVYLDTIYHLNHPIRYTSEQGSGIITGCFDLYRVLFEMDEEKQRVRTYTPL